MAFGNEKAFIVNDLSLTIVGLPYNTNNMSYNSSHSTTTQQVSRSLFSLCMVIGYKRKGWVNKYWVALM